MKGNPAMSKLDFDCSLSNSSPCNTEGAQGALDTEDDEDDSNSVESDSEEMSLPPLHPAASPNLPSG